MHLVKPNKPYKPRSSPVLRLLPSYLTYDMSLKAKHESLHAYPARSN